MGWFGRLVGTEKALSDITDKDNGLLVRMGGWVNDLNFTDEERSKAQQEVREWGIRQLTALEPFKVVQRVIAFGATGMWIFLGINVIVGIWLEALFPKLDVVMSLLDFAYSQYIFWPIAIVYSLYFSGGVLPQLIGKNKGVQQQ